MTLQTITGITDLWLPSLEQGVTGVSVPGAALDTVIDAATEACLFTGSVHLEGRTGTKTISSAGGKIHWMSGAATITFANATTNLRIGLQDVILSAGQPARGDGVYDVQADLVGGTDTIAATTFISTPMESGSMTLTHGQLVCISIEMTARGGVDVVRVRHPIGAAPTTPLGYDVPGVTAVTAGPVYTNVASIPLAVIEFDDGTLGFIDGGFVTSTATISTAVLFDSGTTPDEYALIFQVPFSCTIDALAAIVLLAGATSDFELILYSDPEGTPAVVEAITVDAHSTQTTGTRWVIRTLATPRTLLINTKYAIAVRPLSTNDVTIRTYDVATAAHWKAHSLGANCYIGSRTNQTGGFSTTATQRMWAGARISALSDDVGGGGGGGLIRHPGMAGGLSA